MMFGGGGTYILQWTFSWKKRRMMERRPFIFFILPTILMTMILLLPNFDGRETPRLHKRLVFNSFATHTEETAGIIVFWSFYSLQFWTPLPVHHLFFSSFVIFYSHSPSGQKLQISSPRVEMIHVASSWLVNLQRKDSSIQCGRAQKNRKIRKSWSVQLDSLWKCTITSAIASIRHGWRYDA